MADENQNPDTDEIDEDDEFQRLLDDFIASELGDAEDKDEDEDEEEDGEESDDDQDSPPPSERDDDDDEESSEEENPAVNALKEEEKNLYLAYSGLQDAINAITDEAGMPAMAFAVTPEMLQPNYKPSVGKKIAGDTIAVWDVLIKAKPNKITGIKPDSTDEQLLDFAEAIDDNLLTLAIISYVETIIEIEGCEISYREKCLKAERKRIEREIRAEHQKRADRSKRYIEEINKQKFPIDAERLISNYFKTASKDIDGAFQVLTNNPAVFAPIDVAKIKPRFFGLLKVTPQDGIRINKLIGKFLSKLKI